jgi:hypothetical protein
MVAVPVCAIMTPPAARHRRAVTTNDRMRPLDTLNLDMGEISADVNRG